MNGLEARVGALERSVATLAGQRAGGETRTPSYLTITPTGQVGADFTGLINALGLIIPAGISTQPQPQNQIVWEETNGGIVANIFAADFAGETELSLQSENPAQNPSGGGAVTLESQATQGIATLSAGGPGAAALTAEFVVSAGAAGGSAILQALAFNSSAIVIDNQQRSNFVQLPTASETFLQTGGVSFGLSGPGYTGPYAVTFPHAFAVNPVVVVSIQPTGAANTITSSEIVSPTTTGFSVDINSTITQSVIVYWIALAA